MPKTLKDLYYGNLMLFDHPIPSGSPVRKLSAHLTECEAKLKEQLSEEGQAQLKKLVHTQQEMDCATAEENFIMGFRLGVRIMVECLGREEGD